MEITNETIENAEVVFVAYEQPTVKEQVVATLIGVGVTATVYIAAVGVYAAYDAVVSRARTRKQLKELNKKTTKTSATEAE